MFDDLTAPQPSALCTFDVKNTFPGLTTNKSVNTLSVKPTPNSMVRWATAFVGQQSLRSGVHFVEFKVESTNHISIQTNHGVRFCAHQMFGVSPVFGNSAINSETHPFAYAKKPIHRSRAWATDLTLWANDRPGIVHDTDQHCNHSSMRAMWSVC